MSYVVCLFFVVMQFFWRYAEEFIGKGLSTLVLLEVIFHACLAFTPMALPLAILLSTVMTMGNLGESLELRSPPLPHHTFADAADYSDGCRALRLL